MCGNVGIFNKKGITPVQQGLFENMLWMDSIRGYHSTGVIAVEGQGDNYSVIKEAVDGAYFTQTVDWKEFLNAHKNPKILIGHNRWATQGEVNKQNSHPFSFGHVSGVHNGTLDRQSYLPDSEKFEVDSENIYWSFYKKGVEWTLERLEGAFALVWYDSKEKCLNFVRNDERPLHIAELNDGTIIWGSEKGMLDWLTSRTTKISSIKATEKLKEGVWRRFYLDGKMVDTEVSIVPSWKQCGGYYDYRYGNYRSPQKALPPSTTTSASKVTDIGTKAREDDNKKLINAGMPWRVGSRVKVTMEEFRPYPNSSGMGSIRCYSEEASTVDDVVVSIGSQTINDFVPDKEVEGTVVYVYPFKVHGIKIVLSDITEPSKVAEKELMCGSKVSKAYFDNHMKKKCYSCGDTISYNELDVCIKVNDTNLTCGHCVEELYNI